ncbi:MAG TPA: outer membrane beta-barrel protein, partial [Cyclobacteriaceae bacterium]|nr:outer membrane beta-barrel protein [Cyclobacteriaceae bacterium]
MVRRKRIILWWILALGLSLPAAAQFRLPQMDADLKGAYSLFDAGSNEDVDHMNSASIQGGVHIAINQHIAVGAFYMKSISGKVVHKDGAGATTAKNELKTLMTGFDIRLSAGRSVKWRPYILLSYSKVEFVESYSGYNLAHSTWAPGANIGVMLRLGNTLYWNV